MSPQGLARGTQMLLVGAALTGGHPWRRLLPLDQGCSLSPEPPGLSGSRSRITARAPGSSDNLSKESRGLKTAESVY